MYWSQRCQNLHSSSHPYALQMFFYKNVSISNKNQNWKSSQQHHHHQQHQQLWHFHGLGFGAKIVLEKTQQPVLQLYIFCCSANPEIFCSIKRLSNFFLTQFVFFLKKITCILTKKSISRFPRSPLSVDLTFAMSRLPSSRIWIRPEKEISPSEKKIENSN